MAHEAQRCDTRGRVSFLHEFNEHYYSTFLLPVLYSVSCRTALRRWANLVGMSEGSPLLSPLDRYYTGRYFWFHQIGHGFGLGGAKDIRLALAG